MTEEFNRKISKAVKKLLTLEQVTLSGTFTSHYSYGMLPPCLEDRYNLEIKIDSDLTLKMQVSFDSKYLSFPPDIVVHNLPAEQSQDLSALLPQSDFNLGHENCLYTWFKRILSLFKKPEPTKRWPVFDDMSKRNNIPAFKPSSSSSGSKPKEPTKTYETNMYSDGDFVDELLDIRENMDIEEIPAYKQDRYKLKNKEDFIADTSDFFADQDEALSYKTREHEFEASLFAEKSPTTGSSDTFTRAKRSYVDHIMTEASQGDSDDDEIILPTYNSQKKIQPNPEPLHKKKRMTLVKPTIYNTKMEGKIEYRKKFMYGWLSKYKSFTLLVQFRLSKSKLHTEFKRRKERNMEVFLEEHPEVVKVFKFKQAAPIMINFKMNLLFPSSPLEIKLISVLNTTSVRSDEPDTKDLKYSVTRNESLSKTVNDIMNLITDAVPAFHYQM
ncbi:hypothetical protein HPULCUR_007479 [Helicostylum pulchrum]|uniref:Uncharacterized protein n=1 Tax=Helicostylum pulchrum TaxID=562976 RepID=A0ABP9Y4W8_9FUNG